MNPQLEGLEDLEGTYIFDLRTSYRTLRLNRFFWDMIRADHRARFLEDEEGAYADAGLSEAEKVLLRNRDWIGLIQYGVSFFVLEKWARVVKMSNLQVYARMRGETFEEFLKTRRVPDAQ